MAAVLIFFSNLKDFISEGLKKKWCLVVQRKKKNQISHSVVC